MKITLFVHSRSKFLEELLWIPVSIYLENRSLRSFNDTKLAQYQSQARSLESITCVPLSAQRTNQITGFFCCTSHFYGRGWELNTVRKWLETIYSSSASKKNWNASRAYLAYLSTGLAREGPSLSEQIKPCQKFCYTFQIRRLVVNIFWMIWKC